MGPIPLEEITPNQDPAGVLKFEKILHAPRCASIFGVVDLPAQRLGYMVTADLDVSRDQVADGGISTTEHHVLTRRLEVIVDDLEGTRAVPARDGLRVSANLLEVRQVGIDDGGSPGIERYAAARPLHGIAVEVGTVDNDVVREFRLGSVR
jgi:hypothetical protein